jgi:DNA-binding CsgD family transcriptional regulator
MVKLPHKKTFFFTLLTFLIVHKAIAQDTPPFTYLPKEVLHTQDDKSITLNLQQARNLVNESKPEAYIHLSFLYQHAKSDSLRGLVAQELALFFFRFKQPDSAEYYLKEATAHLPKSKLRRTKVFLANSYATSEEFTKSLQLHREVWESTPKADYANRVASCINLSYLFVAIKAPDSARHYIKLGIQIGEKHLPNFKTQDGRYWALKSNEAEVLSLEKKHNEAITLRDTVSDMLNQIAPEYYRLIKHELLYQNAKDYRANGQPQPALESLTGVTEHLSTNPDLVEHNFLAKVWHLQSEIYETQEALTQALYAYKQFKIHTDSINQEEVQLFHSQMEQNLIINQYRLHMIETQNALKAASLRNTIYISIGVFLLLLLGLLLYVFYQKQQRIKLLKAVHVQKEELAKERNQRIKNELDIAQQEAKHKQEALQQQEALNKQQKLQISQILNESLRKSEQFKELLKTVEAKEAVTVKELQVSLRKKIEHFQHSEDEWEKLKVHFEEVNQDFFQKILAIDSSLTTSSLRFCAYIRMGLSDKEIALLFGINPHSISVRRYRLRKKLGFESNQELFEFLQQA